jgi:hypothetical protein
MLWAGEHQLLRLPFHEHITILGMLSTYGLMLADNNDPARYVEPRASRARSLSQAQARALALPAFLPC